MLPFVRVSKKEMLNITFYLNFTPNSVNFALPFHVTGKISSFVSPMSYPTNGITTYYFDCEMVAFGDVEHFCSLMKVVEIFNVLT